MSSLWVTRKSSRRKTQIKNIDTLKNVDTIVHHYQFVSKLNILYQENLEIFELVVYPRLELIRL